MTVLERIKARMLEEVPDGLFKTDPEKYDEAFLRIHREELPEGGYQIAGGEDNLVLYTGKEGYIQFELALMQEMRGRFK
jgi:hypothetical protein